MTRRVVAVLVPSAPTGAVTTGPTGIEDQLRLAMVEDVYETVAALELVEAALVARADDPALDALSAMTWPGTTIHLLTVPGDGRRSVTERALRLLAESGAEQVTLVAGDAPDLPGLLVGKLHRALGSCDVAVLPAATGGAVALATGCPVPDWLCAAHTDDDTDDDSDDDSGSGVDIDDADVVATLRARAPRRTSVSVGPGWHRVRATADLALLDPGLEGWEVTRDLLRGR